MAVTGPAKPKSPARPAKRPPAGKPARPRVWPGLNKVLQPPRLSPGAAPIVPPTSVAGRALTVVIAIMCFLACLTAGAVYLVNQSAAAWSDDIASEVTVQVRPQDGENVEKKLTAVSLLLARQSGIAQVRPLTLDESKQLLEPWLGNSDAISQLPIPRLIAVEIDRGHPPDFAKLRQALDSNFQAVTLDDHSRWQAQIRTLTRSLALGGIAVLILVAAATVAVIVSATRSAMSSNREIIEVLHFVGAKDRFIANQFEAHFLTLGVRAGLVGALAAVAVFLLMPGLTHLLGGSSMTGTEVRRLVGTAVLDLPGYLLFGLVVVIVALLCMVTSRLGVYRVLRNQV